MPKPLLPPITGEDTEEFDWWKKLLTEQETATATGRTTPAASASTTPTAYSSGGDNGKVSRNSNTSTWSRGKSSRASRRTRHRTENRGGYTVSFPASPRSTFSGKNPRANKVCEGTGCC